MPHYSMIIIFKFPRSSLSAPYCTFPFVVQLTLQYAYNQDGTRPFILIDLYLKFVHLVGKFNPKTLGVRV